MSVASKNPFGLLDNEDGDAEVAQVSGVRTAKADVKAPAARRPAGSGNEAAFRDRNAGSDRNRSKTTEEVPRNTPRGGQGARVRGGRGGRFPRERDDRHSKGPASSEKTPTGYVEGEAEKRDEEAGEAIAKSDEKAASTEEAAAVDEDAEPEEKQVSYEEYLAQQAEKKLALGGASLAVRQANEGASNKQWEAAKPLVKDETEAFIAPSASKTKRERERKTKQVLEIDQRYVEPERPRGGAGERGGFRGGRGGGRGGFERGERSERGGDASFRGSRGGPRGGPRGGGRGRGESSSRGGPRGGGVLRGAPRSGAGAGPVLNPKDENLFPSLGSS